jgi:flagellar biosynthesis protein FlhG
MSSSDTAASSAPDTAGASPSNSSPSRRRPPRARPAPVRAGRILAVGGGKGGIGKTLLSANLGIELSRRGMSVVLVDCDLGGANLHTALGVEPAKGTLSDFVLRRVEDLHEVLTPTEIPNLQVVSGALDSLDIANPLYQQKLRLLRAVQGLAVDVVLLDLGAGTSFNVLDFFLLADHGLLTLVPEPTSVENAYRFLKAAFYRRLKAVEQVYGLGPVLDAVGGARHPGVRSPLALVAAVRERDPAAAEILEREMQAFRPLLVVNQVREAADLQVGPGVVAAWKRFFGLDLHYLGYLRHDDEAWRAIRSRRPLLLERLDQPIAHDIADLADALLALPPARSAGEP